MRRTAQLTRAGGLSIPAGEGADLKGKIQRRLARFLKRRDVVLTPFTPIVTITFDDTYSGACNRGAEIIEQAGGRATYYVCGGLDRTRSGDCSHHTADDLKRLQERGHEIACHGFGHLNYQETSSADIQRDLDLNAEYFAEHGIRRAQNFAYPYGCVSPRVKEICGSRFRSSRGVQAATNGQAVDLALLKSVPLYSSRLNADRVTALVEQTQAAGGWLIFFSHDVTTAPGEFDVTPDLLAWAVAETLRCMLPIKTMNSALDCYGVN